MEESRDQIVKLIENYSIVVVIGTGGKGTGAGTTFPLADIVRRQNKLVLPVFVRPSFERHEVDKRRYDHALHVGLQFDEARIRLIEILNDHAYSDRDPQPQSVVWERMNLPIARGLRGLIYVLWDLSEVDPSDLSMLLAGNGRMRIGFGEIDPPEGHDPTDAQIREAVDACWQNPYCAFTKRPGTSLVCIQGDWSNLADAKIKSEIAARALGNVPDGRYNPLYARAVHTPRPWGVTALFTEYTGAHEPMPLAWASNTRLNGTSAARRSWMSRRAMELSRSRDRRSKRRVSTNEQLVHCLRPLGILLGPSTGSTPSPWNSLPVIPSQTSSSKVPRSGSSSARSGSDRSFRSSPPHGVSACLTRSPAALLIPNHVLSRGRQAVHLADGSYQDLKAIAASTAVSGAAGADLHLVLAIVGLWGEEARRRLRFADVAASERSSRLGALFGMDR